MRGPTLHGSLRGLDPIARQCAGGRWGGQDHPLRRPPLAAHLGQLRPVGLTDLQDVSGEIVEQPEILKRGLDVLGLGCIPNAEEVIHPSLPDRILR